MCVAVNVGSNVKRVVETDLRPAIVVVADEQHWLADNRGDCVLVFLWQAVEEPLRDRCQHDHVARLRPDGVVHITLFSSLKRRQRTPPMWSRGRSAEAVFSWLTQSPAASILSAWSEPV